MTFLAKREKPFADPFRELREISEQINRVFALDPFFKPTDGEGQAMTAIDWAPSVNISETDKAYLVRADLPEVKKEDVKVSCEDGMLSIEGERKQQKTEENERVHRVESSYGRFLRRFTLPADADENSIEANYKDGALTVRIVRVPGKATKARQIKVA
jgi:HSP20 family protein